MNNKKNNNSRTSLREGYNPLKKGYSPNKGNLDASKPPQGGTGVPKKPNTVGNVTNSRGRKG
jgi:hypothetical protein